MKPIQPIRVTHLFPEVLDELLSLLSGLSPVEWDQPTACSPWTVKEVAQHLLGGDIGILSRKRDSYTGSSKPIKDWSELVAFINTLNDTWIKATGRISPRLLCDLLEFTGRQVGAHFQALDPDALGGPVSWAGPDPAPVWLDLAREYTERWHHQQHIRDAVGQPGLKESKFFAPVLDAFIRAWPHTYRALRLKMAPSSCSLSPARPGDTGFFSDRAKHGVSTWWWTKHPRPRSSYLRKWPGDYLLKVLPETKLEGTPISAGISSWA